MAYTDLIARFSDQLCAEKLVEFIASRGISCDLVEIWDPIRTERWAVRVQTAQLAELQRALDLKPVACGLTETAAQMMAGRLARENIPCYVGGSHNPGLWGDSDVPIRETTTNGDMLAVPESYFSAALKALNVAAVSEAELAELAQHRPSDAE